MTDHTENETAARFQEEFRQAERRINLRRSVTYLSLLLSDIDEALKVFASGASEEQSRDTFQRLMTLVLAPSDGWARLYKFSDRLGFSVSSVMRYALRQSAPVPFLFPKVLSVAREIICEERVELERVLLPLEEEARLAREAQQAEWAAFRSRTETVIPGTGLNCQVRFSTEPPEEASEEWTLDFLFAYPCRGVYDLSTCHSLVCPVCAEEGKESSSTHGRVILASEDGLMLLPHIVRTQKDLLQVLSDMRDAEGLFLSVVTPVWLEACQQFLLGHPVVSVLPEGGAEPPHPQDLTEAKLGWFSL